jgi:2-phospho-L-lactate/phosphoenolpyruvate guanylyltransferase
MNTFVAVPVKDLASAKQRLIPALDADQRRRLARAMLEDVLTALGASAAGSVVVVTTDAEVMDVARRHDAACLVERANRGHTEAVGFAQREAETAGARRFLTIPGDVPCVTAEEIRLVLAALGAERGVVFVPSLSGFGTNAALLAPPGLMPLKFGEPSFDNHLEAARQRELSPVVLELPGLGLDIDGPEDLPFLIERGPGTRSAALLREWRISGRFRDGGEASLRVS